MRLHHGRVSINIDDESWDVVALAMHQTVCIVMRVVHDADAASHLEGRLESALPEHVVDIDVAKREHSHGYRSYLIVSHSDEVTF